MEQTPPKAHISRKEFLRQAAVMGIGLSVVGTSACSLLDEPEMQVCSLEELTAQGHIIAKFNRKKIFVTRLEGELTIFSLICSHKKCTVGYEADTQQFICPCHDGIYDKYGEVVDGPPPEPLPRFKAEVREGMVWVKKNV